MPYPFRLWRSCYTRRGNYAFSLEFTWPENAQSAALKRIKIII
jgi:hypothetical protein